MKPRRALSTRNASLFLHVSWNWFARKNRGRYIGAMMKSLATAALSLLDLAKVSDHSTIGKTYAHSRRLAQLAEGLGYKRFWLAEHHNMPAVASAATAILIGHIAEHTK